MVKNYLKIALRNILKSKIFSFINILGLALGLAAFILIIQYVRFELSYDRFHDDSEQIYRVSLDQYLNNELMITSAENYPGVGPAMVSEIPGVLGFARLYNMGYKNNLVITYEDAPDGPIQFKHRKFLYADSSFLPMFGYEMIMGDATTALAEPLTAVLSEKYAKMYFGNENPIGKMIRLQDDDFNNELAKVTGVVKDLPDNTHLKFDVLYSYKTLLTRGDFALSRYEQSWQRKDMYTYIKLDKGVSADIVEQKLPELVTKYSPDLADRNREDKLALQPITSIHLYSNLAEEPEPNSQADTVYALLLIAIFILVIAWVNYINLSTAKAMERANEVGVRKAMGAFRVQLMRQFLVESTIINLIAILIAMFFVMISIPLFNNISGLSFEIMDFMTFQTLLITVGLWLIGTVLSGLYPAFFLASFNPISVLKSKLRNSGKGVLLRKSLVIFQFMASVGLIAGTMIVYNQLSYMMAMDIGMNTEQVLVVERPGVMPREREVFESSVDVFRNELKQHPHIQSVASSVTIPGKKREYKVGVKKYGEGDDASVTLKWNSMDFKFMDVFEMNLLAGRVFSEDFVNDPDTSVVLTKSASKLLGFENPEDAVGQTLSIPNFRWNPIVVGVVNDYHQESLKKSQDPIIFYCTLYGGEFYSIKINATNTQETIQHVRDSWNKAFPGNPFEFFFLDDYFNRQYENDQRFGDLFAVFAALAILVGCLGLFGLSAYTAEQRTKEIGIRKVLGSSVAGIFVLLSKGFVVLITVSIIVASPLTYYFMDSWLNNFAYKQSIDLKIFLFAGLAVVLISLITISFQTVKAARINPVKSLRYE